MYNTLSFVRRVSQLGTIVMSRFFGERVGADQYGNLYYKSRSLSRGAPEKRWVLYAGEPEPTMVPPDWYGWLHHLCDQPLRNDPECSYVWLKPHQPNLSGSEAASLTPMHPLNQMGQGGRAEREVYQSWQPHE